MNSNDYEFLCNFLMQASGLSLGPNKEYLIEARLHPVAQSWGLADVGELIEYLRTKKDMQLNTAVTEAMTTNETSFFRDKRPFDDFEKVMLPELIESRASTQTLRIWCAACSTGQEPYSLAILIREKFPALDNWNLEIVATDLAEQVLDRARAGIYSQFEVQRGMPINLLMKHFSQVPEGWQISETLREQMDWRQLNLLDNFTGLGQFDIVFCRNVLIYFETETKKSIVEKISRVLRPDGFFLLGAAETLLGFCDSYQRLSNCESSVYRPAAGVLV